MRASASAVRARSHSARAFRCSASAATRYSAKNPRRYAHAAEDVQNIVKTVARYQNHWKFADETKKQELVATADRYREQALELRKKNLATTPTVEPGK